MRTLTEAYNSTGKMSTKTTGPGAGGVPGMTKNNLEYYHAWCYRWRGKKGFVMEEILKKAEELGRLIRDTDTYRDFQHAAELLHADKDAEKLLDEFITISKYIRDRQEMGDIIEKFEIENIKSMSETVSGNEMIMQYLKAQQEYLDLILIIQKELEDVGPDEC